MAATAMGSLQEKKNDGHHSSRTHPTAAEACDHCFQRLRSQRQHETSEGNIPLFMPLSMAVVLFLLMWENIFDVSKKSRMVIFLGQTHIALNRFQSWNTSISLSGEYSMYPLISRSQPFLHKRRLFVEQRNSLRKSQREVM
jgi:hypothetical protein